MVHQNVLTFWFDELTPRQWWRVDPDLDAQIACRFGAFWDQARRGELHDWRRVAYGRLAEVIVLDQFSRNVHRNTPHAFSQDAIALVLAQEAVAAGALEVLSPVECSFLLMPYMQANPCGFIRQRSRCSQPIRLLKPRITNGATKPSWSGLVVTLTATPSWIAPRQTPNARFWNSRVRASEIRRVIAP